MGDCSLVGMSLWRAAAKVRPEIPAPTMRIFLPERKGGGAVEAGTAIVGLVVWMFDDFDGTLALAKNDKQFKKLDLTSNISNL